jgi:hypothetical protein
VTNETTGVWVKYVSVKRFNIYVTRTTTDRGRYLLCPKFLRQDLALDSSIKAFISKSCSEMSEIDVKIRLAQFTELKFFFGGGGGVAD